MPLNDLYYIYVTEAISFSKHYETIPSFAFEHDSVLSSEHSVVCTDCAVVTFGT